MRKIVPYVFFDGNAKEAMNFYSQVFGGKLELMTLAEMPGDNPIPEEDKNRVMYSCLTADDFRLRAADRMPAMTKNSGPPTGVDLSVDFATVDETKKMYARLSEGGNAMMEPQETFFSPCFCTFKDKFGVSWMLVTDTPS